MGKFSYLIIVSFLFCYCKTAHSQIKIFCSSDSRGTKYQLELVEGAGTIQAKTFSNTGSLTNTINGTWSVQDGGVYGPAYYLTAIFSSGTMKFLIVRDGSGQIQELKDVVANRKFYPCSNGSNGNGNSKIDGSMYSWNQEKKPSGGKISVGDQVWASENLSVKRFRNGDIIPQTKTNDEWKKASMEKKPAWCYYNNDSIVGRKYGIMYNFYAVSDPRGLAPEGWRVPTSNDWAIFFKEMGDIGSIYSREANNIKARNEWAESDITSETKFSNTSGFTALPSGFRLSDGKFEGKTECAYWWASDASLWGIFSSSHKKKIYYNSDKGNGVSVRLIQGEYIKPAVNSSAIIGTPFKISNLEVAANDFPEDLTYNEAIEACSSLGNGWRLPTSEEFKIIAENQNAVHMTHSTPWDINSSFRKITCSSNKSEPLKFYYYWISESANYNPVQVYYIFDQIGFCRGRIALDRIYTEDGARPRVRAVRTIQ